MLRTELNVVVGLARSGSFRGVETREMVLHVVW